MGCQDINNHSQAVLLCEFEDPGSIAINPHRHRGALHLVAAGVHVNATKLLQLF